MLLPVPNLSWSKWKSASFCSNEEVIFNKSEKFNPPFNLNAWPFSFLTPVIRNSSNQTSPYIVWSFLFKILTNTNSILLIAGAPLILSSLQLLHTSCILFSQRQTWSAAKYSVGGGLNKPSSFKSSKGSP